MAMDAVTASGPMLRCAESYQGTVAWRISDPVKTAAAAVRSRIAVAAPPGHETRVALGEDVGGAVTVVADGRKGQEQGVVVGGQRCGGGQGPQDLEGCQKLGERQPVGDPAAERCAADAYNPGEADEGADLREAEAGDAAAAAVERDRDGRAPGHRAAAPLMSRLEGAGSRPVV
ncbi:hypothetical protein [Streptomyces lutosisoli]|uniref:Uncharacterized protein n=1 Tax=Streptomyces lutosisoli TaxID=2665721 RepID=A0ABW2VNS8_9ACTN